MACDITLGRIVPCKDSVGGLDAVYFVNNGDATGYTYDVTDTDMIATVTGTPTAFKWDLKGTSTFEQSINSSIETGTTFFEQTLTLNFNKLDVATHKQIKLLAFGQPNVIVRDNNGNYFLAGLEFGMDVTGGSIATGGAMGDMSGYTLTLVGREKIPANFIDVTTDAELVTAGYTVTVGA